MYVVELVVPKIHHLHGWNVVYLVCYHDFWGEVWHMVDLLYQRLMKCSANNHRILLLYLITLHLHIFEKQKGKNFITACRCIIIMINTRNPTVQFAKLIISH